MTPKLDTPVLMLQMATRPLWTWYTRQVKKVKTQFDAIDYAISMVLPLEGWSWMGEEHLRDLAKVLCSEEVSKFNCENDSLSALKIFELIMQLLAGRTWSLAVRRALPPEQYAGVLSPEKEVRKTSLELLRKHHECLLKWEDDVTSDPSLKESVVAQQLQENVCFAVNRPARLMMDAFESIDYDHRRLRGYGHKTSVVLGQNHKEAGEHLLQTLIQTFPDNKIVEDVHNALRLEARGNKNNKLTPSTMQSVCMNSGVLESRGISHQAEVSESEFIQALGSVKRVKEMYFSKVHVLPEEYISICSTRSWSAFTEESLETGAAAWAWLQFQSQTLSVFGNLKATSGVFSKVARRGLVFQLEDTVSSPPQFSLGHADWGVLMWPLELYDSDDEVEYYTLHCDVEAKAKCEFLHDPQEWKVVEMEPVWRSNMICLHCNRSSWENLLDVMLKDRT